MVVAGSALHSHGVLIGNGEKPTFQQSKRLKTRLSKHTRAATFEPSKAGLLSLQTLNLSEEMSGNIPGHLLLEEIVFIEVRKPAQPCSDSRALPKSSLSRHRLEGRFSSLLPAECLASLLAARISSTCGRKPVAASILTGAARAFS